MDEGEEEKRFNRNSSHFISFSLWTNFMECVKRNYDLDREIHPSNADWTPENCIPPQSSPVSGYTVPTNFEEQPSWHVRLLRYSPRLWGIRTIITFCFLISLLAVGTLVSVSCLIFGIWGVSTNTVKNNVLVKTIVEDFFRDRWVGAGIPLLDAVDEYLQLRENDLDLKFRDTSTVDYFHLFLHRIFQNSFANAHVSSIEFGTPRGVIIGVHSGSLAIYSDETTRDNPCCSYHSVHSPAPLNHRAIYSDNSFGAYEKQRSPYDHRVSQNGWYSRSVNSSETYAWTTTLTGYMNYEKYLHTSVSKRVFDTNGTFRGVVKVLFEVSEYSDFLDEIVNKTGAQEVFVVDSLGQLLSNSLDAAVYRDIGDMELIQRDTGEYELLQIVDRIMASASENEIISSVSKKIISKFGSWNNVTNANENSIIFDRQRMISFVSPSIDGHFHIFICSYSVYHVYHNVLTAGITNVFVVSFTSFYFLVVCVMSMILMTQPVFKLISEMKKIENMNLDDISLRKSSLYEVRALQNAFLLTVEKLREYRSFLPLNLADESFSEFDEEHPQNIDPLGLQNNEAAVEEISSPSPDGDSVASSVVSNSSGVVFKQTFSDKNSQFDLKLRETKRIFVFVKIEGIDEMLKLSPESRNRVIAFTSLLYDNIIRLTSVTRGRLREYHLDTFSITFKKLNEFLEFFAPLLSSLGDLMGRFPLLSAKVGGIAGRVWLGNIGSQKLKKGIIWGKSVDFLLKVLSKYEASKTVETLLGDTLALELPHKYTIKPIQLHEGFDGRCYIGIFRVEHILGIQNSNKYVGLVKIFDFFFHYCHLEELRKDYKDIPYLNEIERLMKEYVRNHRKDLETSVVGFKMIAAVEKFRNKQDDKEGEELVRVEIE